MYDDYEYDYFITEEQECPSCKKLENKLEEASEFFSSVLKQLYSKSKLDCIELERDLDELAHILKVKLIPGDLQIERKSNKVISFDEWKNYTTVLKVTA